VAQASNMTVKINGAQTITIAAGSTFGSYSNATAFNADDLQINDYSKFAYVKIFNTLLDAAIILSYSDGSMWDYMQNAVVIMDGKLRNYDPTNTRITDASANANNMALTASGFTKNIKKGYSQNTATTASAHVATLSSTIASANSGTQSLFWLGKLKSANYTPLMANSNFAVGITNSQTIYSRSFKPDKSYTNRVTSEKANLNHNNSICSIKSNQTLSVVLNRKKCAITASETGYERDITKFAFGYNLDLYADTADITTTSGADVVYCAFFNIALNIMQIIDLELSINANSKE
jgi:hypothetical protein